MRANRLLPAVGFLIVAAGAIAGAVVAPEFGDVLVALAGTGVYGAILFIALTGRRYVPASVSRSIYEALSENEATMASESGFDGGFRYVPGDSPADEVRLAALRTEEHQTSSTLTSDDTPADAPSALFLKPTGSELFAEFEASYGDLPENPEEVIETLVEVARDEFELADSLTIKRESRDSLATLRVTGSVVGDTTHIDHPLQSFVSVGLVKTIGKPISAESRPVPETKGTQIMFRVEPELKEQYFGSADDSLGAQSRSD